MQILIKKQCDKVNWDLSNKIRNPQVIDTVSGRVWEQVREQVWENVSNQIWNKIIVTVWEQVYNQIYDQIN